MKKSLLALAAMGAFAGAAQAQSSVTVYGILDQSFSSLNQRAASGTAVTNSTNAIIGGNGSETTSRLGFRGTEDLGGGTSAFFTIEVAITPNSNQNFSQSVSANRQTFIGLRQKGIGAVSFGTQYTPIHTAMGATDPGQQNNVVGNVVYPNAGLTQQNNQTSAQADGGTFGYVVRSANSALFRSDSFAGFVGTLFYTQNNANTNQVNVAAPNTGYTAGTNNQSGYGIGINYTWQKLLATANYQSFKSENPYTANATATTFTAGAPAAWGANGGAAPAVAGGSNVNDTQMYFAATYDFGILKAYAQYLDRKVENNLNTSQYFKRSAQQIGVRGFATKTIEYWASVGNGRVQAFGAGQPTANFTGYQLGSNYWLSKRTNLYAIWGVTGTSNVSSVAGDNPRSSNASQYAIGARHTF